MRRIHGTLSLPNVTSRTTSWAAALAAALTMVAAGAGSAPAATNAYGAGSRAANTAGAARAVASVRAGAPGRPRYLGISISARHAVLTWAPGRASARIAGYRVYR